MSNINVTRSSMPPFEEYCEEIKELWDSRWLTNNGIKHREFEEKLENILGVPNVTLYTNGHLALENALSLFSFPNGSEVITTPFTFASTTHAISRSGLTPVFCDVNEDDFTINPEKIEALITDKTVAVMPVHVYGTICDVEKIQNIADKYGLKVIYDAAHAFYETKCGKSVAAFGDFSMFSFHATKVFHTIEGGALCYSDDSFEEKLYMMKNFGYKNNCSQLCGGNAKMNEFQAAMGICNLRHIEEEIAKRKNVAGRYRERLDNIPEIQLAPIQEGVVSNYAYFPMVTKGYKYSRDEIAHRLGEQGILARKYFAPATNSFECYKRLPTSEQNGATPISKMLCENVLCLPIYADLSLSDVDRICDIILS